VQQQLEALSQGRPPPPHNARSTTQAAQHTAGTAQGPEGVDGGGGGVVVVVVVVPMVSVIVLRSLGRMRVKVMPGAASAATTLRILSMLTKQ